MKKESILLKELNKRYLRIIGLILIVADIVYIASGGKNEFIILFTPFIALVFLLQRNLGVKSFLKKF